MNARTRRICAYFCAPVLVSIGIAVFVGSSPRVAKPPGKVQLDWGLYQILWSHTYCDQLNTTLEKFATTPHYVMFYRDLERPFPLHAITCIHDHGAIPIVSLELWHWHDQRPQLEQIRAGNYDDAFRVWATDARKYGHPVFLRFGFEFNGDWFSWSGDPEAYRAAWRHVHDLFTQVGADNVTWVWAPNVQSCPDEPTNAAERYYPGDDYVDWIGVDGYNFGDDHDKWHHWSSFESIFAKTLTALHTQHPDKPIMISEFACADGEPARRAGWIREAYAFLRQRHEVRAAVWFNYDKRREGEPNWRIDTSAESLAAFNATFAAKAKSAAP